MRSSVVVRCPVCLLLLLLPLLSLALTEAATSREDPLDLDAEEDGSGSRPDDEDLGDLFADVVDEVSFRCYSCTGVSGETGCNLTALAQNPRDFTTQCTGHCINITSGTSIVFECMNDVPVRKTTCLQNQGTHMCMCGTDLCNGPVLPLDHVTGSLVPQPPSDDNPAFQRTSVTMKTEQLGETVTIDTGSPQQATKTSSSGSSFYNKIKVTLINLAAVLAALSVLLWR